MTIEYVSGDIFLNRYEAQALAYGCNCKGAMGAGIAKGFRERYPDMYEKYRRLCKAKPRQFNLGESLLWKTDDKPWIFNLGTQEDFWRYRAGYEAIEKALEMMKHQADQESITNIAMPRIGAGYGDLSWNKVRPIIERVFDDWSGMLYIYEEYHTGE